MNQELINLSMAEGYAQQSGVFETLTTGMP